MNILKKIIILSAIGIVLVSCADRQARHPITKKTITFLKESAMKNKALLASEEALIDSIIKKDTLHSFVDSQHGFKFYYLNQNPEAHYTAQFGDIVTYDYSLSDLQGNQLYQEKPDGEYKYYVDKEEVFQGLRSALKLAYGYRGDKDKISFNQPIIAKIEVFKIEKNQEDVKPRPE